MPKKTIKTTAEENGILPVLQIVKSIEQKIDAVQAPVKKERAKKILTPEESAKRKAILSERLIKARAVKASKKAESK